MSSKSVANLWSIVGTVSITVGLFLYSTSLALVVVGAFMVVGGIATYVDAQEKGGK
jgi:hypothetical protein